MIIGDLPNDAYDLNYFLYVNGTTYNPSGTYTLADGGRSVVLPAVSIAGLNVSREIFVPATGGNFVRFLNVFTNPTLNPITVDITIGGNLGSNGLTIVTGSSDGDNLAEPTDTWFTTDDSNNGAGDPSLGHVLQGLGASETLDSITHSFLGTPFNYFYGTLTFPADGVYRVDSFFDIFTNVTIDPGETVSIMLFGIQDSNNANAIAEATSLATLPSVALAGLTQAERSQIINFNVPPVPEPGTFLLIGLGLLALPFFRTKLK